MTRAPSPRICMTLADTRAAAADAVTRMRPLSDGAINRAIAIVAPHFYPDMTAAPARQQEPLNTSPASRHERTRPDERA